MKYRILLLSVLVLGLILTPIINNLIVINFRIYYIIDYDIRAQDREAIISRVELFNYSSYLRNIPWVHPNYKSYIDADYVLYLKNTIEDDVDFHWELGYEHYLRYSFLASNRINLYLTYNNNMIFEVTDQNNITLLSIEDYFWDDVAWYLNFTHLSYVYTDNNTVLLNNAIFIRLSLEYGYYCGNLCGLWHAIDQYLVLSSTLDVLVLFTYSSGIVVS